MITEQDLKDLVNQMEPQTEGCKCQHYTNMFEITAFINRLKRLNIEVSLVSNFPWIYLEKVNGNAVKEKFYSDHGFTIAFLPIRKDQTLKFTDIPEIFKTIRKYK